MRTPRVPFIAAALALVGLAWSPDALSGQVRLERAAVVFPEDFGAVLAVRELPDGRVLVADPLGKVLYAVDMDAGTRVQVGAEGQGPEEYRQPDAVWPMPGDSTLLVDLGNGRTVTLGPGLRFGPTAPIALTEPGPGRPLVLALPQGVDANGNIYTRAMGGGMGGALPDSATVLRVDRGSRAADTVATIKIREQRRTVTGGANNQNVSISQIPLSPEDSWGVAPDGSIAMARAGDYHLEWLRPDGRITRGSPVAYDAVRIGTAEKEEWVAESARSGGGISIGMSVENGSVSMQFGRGGGSGQPREIDTYEWPDRKPPFYGGRIPVDGMGRAWVRRHVDAGEPSTYDVFGQDGNRTATVILPVGRQVVGFGPTGIYVVTFDEFDLTYLERYDIPAM